MSEGMAERGNRIRNGGVFERNTTDEDGSDMERYWIEL